MRNREAIKLGMKVKITSWAIDSLEHGADRDRKELVGRTGTVIENGLYISVKLDDDPALLPAAVLCVPSEIEAIPDADTGSSSLTA